MSARSPTQPTSVILVRFEARADKFDASTWCNRLDALLTFSRTSFTYLDRRWELHATPRGRLPCIRISSTAGSSASAKPSLSSEPEGGERGETIPDSLFAYEKLVERGDAKELDEGLDDKEVALSRAIQALVEELYWILTRERWYDEFYAARDMYSLRLARLSYPVRLYVGYSVYRDAHGIGGNRPTTEVDRLRDTGFEALASFVRSEEGKNNSKKYVLGKKNGPTRGDAAIFALVAAALTAPHWAPKCAAALRSHPVIIDYAEGLRAEFCPQRPAFA